MHNTAKKFFIKYCSIILCLIVLTSLISLIASSNQRTLTERKEENMASSLQYIELNTGETLKQKYRSDIMILDSFSIYPKQTSQIPVNIKVEAVSTIRGTMSSREYTIDQSSKSLVINFDDIQPHVAERFYINIRIVENSESDSLLISSEKEILLEENVRKDKTELSGSISITATGHDVSYNFKLIAISFIVFLFSLFAILVHAIQSKKFSLTNKLETLMSLLERKKLMFIVEFIFSIVLIAISFLLIYRFAYYRIVPTLTLILFALVTSIFLLFLKMMFSKCKSNYARLFLLLAIPIGLCFCIFIVPDGTPDEPVHFLKSYLVSNLNFTNIANVTMPKEYQFYTIRNYSSLATHVFSSTNYADSYISIQATSYNSILYIVPGITIFISKLFGASIFGAYILAKMSNLIFFLFMGYKAIQISPYGKFILFIYLLNPMMLQQASSLSPDCAIHAVSMLFIAYSLKTTFSPQKLTNKDILIYSLFLTFFLLTKFVYLPLFGMLLLFFRKIVTLSKKQWFYIVIAIISTLLIIFIIKRFIPSGVQPTDQVIRSPGRGGHPEGIDAIAQINLFIQQPLFIFEVIWGTFQELGTFFVNSFFGRYLASLSLPANELAISFYKIIFFLSPLMIQEKFELKRGQRVWLLTLFVGMTSIIILAFFLQWTPVGMQTAYGVQGRYFIPFAILLLFTYSGKKLSFIKKPELIYTISLLAIHIVIISDIIVWHAMR